MSLDDRKGVGGGLREEGEDIQVIEIDIGSAFASVSDDQICEGKTVILLQWAMLNDPLSGPGGGNGA